MFHSAKLRIQNFVDNLRLVSRRSVNLIPANRIFVQTALSDIESYSPSEIHEVGNRSRGSKCYKHANQIKSINGQPEAPPTQLERKDSIPQPLDQVMQPKDELLQDSFGQKNDEVEPQILGDWTETPTRSQDQEGKKYKEMLPESLPPFSPLYLQSHFEILYWSGLSPIRGDGSAGTRAQLVAFICITMLGLCNFFMQLKLYIVGDVQVGNLEHYINICYLTSSLLVQLYMVKLFAFDYKCISAILTDCNRHSEGLHMIRSTKFPLGPFISLGIIIAVAVAISIRPDWLLEGYTLEEIVLSRSSVIGKYAFFWLRDGNSHNLTVMLENKYGQELTPTTIFMGGAGLVLEFVGSLKENLIRDILLMSALHTHRLSEIFAASAKQLLRNEDPTDENLARLTMVHETVLNLTHKIDQAFNNFFLFVHIECWLVCPYNLIEVFRGNFANVYFFASTMVIPKILLSYCIFADAVKKTQQTKYLIEMQYLKCKSDAVDKLDLILFLGILDEHPIAIGHGQFLLDESFASRFVGVVMSCFLLLAGLDQEKPTNCQL